MDEEKKRLEPPSGYQKTEIPGVFRRSGLPWTYFNCPACESRGKTALVLRSRYLEIRLRQLGIPTTDKLAYELCDNCRAHYGAFFEVTNYVPRNKIEWHVGYAISETALGIKELEKTGIPKAYSPYCVKYYQEKKLPTNI